MTKRVTHPPEHQIYPKRYFDASPTWFAWNNLTTTDVQNLRQEPGFEGQQIYFHFNHPIRFVRLVGLVVDIEITRSGKYILITLDDSSGACIEIKTVFREVGEDDTAGYPSNTLVDSLDVRISLGLPTVYVNKKAINIGTAIKAKGKLDSFHDTRQLKLERIWIVKDTNEEVKAWAETAKWKREVLGKPWVLSKRQREEIDEKIARDAVKERERSKRKRVHDAKHAEKKEMKLEKHEARRKRQEDTFNAGALLGSEVLPTRITDS